MNNGAVILAAAAILAAVFLALKNTQVHSDGAAPDTGTDTSTDTGTDTTTDTTSTDTPGIVETIMTKATSIMELWRPPMQYAGAIAQAEADNGIPRDVLARLLYQECRYRDDIITGRVRSSVGAVGIAQFMPATARDMLVDPLDPFASIDAAARYLASLHRQTGTWAKALAAYNWGIGNVQRRGLDAAPSETRTYYAAILADVNGANGSDIA